LYATVGLREKGTDEKERAIEIFKWFCARLYTMRLKAQYVSAQCVSWHTFNGIRLDYYRDIELYDIVLACIIICFVSAVNYVCLGIIFVDSDYRLMQQGRSILYDNR